MSVVHGGGSEKDTAGGKVQKRWVACSPVQASQCTVSLIIKDSTAVSAAMHNAVTFISSQGAPTCPAASRRWFSTTAANCHRQVTS